MSCDFVIMRKRVCCVLLALMMLVAGIALGEDGTNMTEAEWYLQGLKDAEMSLGNNARLKAVMEKARAGEGITIATIGGSVTEGAGAKTYEECWASRLWKRFGTTYGVQNGSNVFFVNAGVGGTASPFGYMRYARDVVSRVPAEDADGLPDVVVIEFSVNDWEEPTGHRCFESMVKEILQAPNEPAVILLFAVFKSGFNLQEDLRKIGDRYQLMMVSIKDGFFGHIGKELTVEEFFSDEYHPTSLGHRIMADCLMRSITDAAEKDADEPQTTDVPAVYGEDFLGLTTIYGDTETDQYTVDRGGFRSIDFKTYHNKPVGWVCGKNFFHDVADPMDPLKVTGVFRKCLVAWKAAQETSFGAAEILIDGQVVKTVQGGAGKWGQSEVILALDDPEPAEHTLEIRVTETGKQFTITAISLR